MDNGNAFRAPLKLKPLVRGWRWRLAGEDRPPLTWALPAGEAMRAMAAEALYALAGSRRLPLCLHGPGAAADAGGRHGHAFWLPEDEDADGTIDHLLIHAEDGLSPAAIRLLAHCDRFELPGHGSWRVIPQWMGDGMAGGLYGPARTWISRTPVFAALNVHRLGLEARVRRELKKRGLIEPEEVAVAEDHVVLGGGTVAPEDFHAERDDGERAADRPRPGFVRLHFAEPVAGPLALGFGAHFGLGQFSPAP